MDHKYVWHLSDFITIKAKNVKLFKLSNQIQRVTIVLYASLETWDI